MLVSKIFLLFFGEHATYTFSKNCVAQTVGVYLIWLHFSLHLWPRIKVHSTHFTFWPWQNMYEYKDIIYIYSNYIYVIYIYMGSGRFPGPMELLLQQLVRVSKTRWRWFNLNKSMLLQPLIKKLEVLVMINQWTAYCINDNNDERWMVVLIDFLLDFL